MKNSYSPSYGALEELKFRFKSLSEKDFVTPEPTPAGYQAPTHAQELDYLKMMMHRLMG